MQFTIWVTEKCNLKCEYCYESGLINKKNMTIDTARKTLDFIYSQICSRDYSYDDFDSIIFHGGEPLLNYDVIAMMINEIRIWDLNHPIFLSLTTNATCLDDEKTLFLLKNLDGISVSIDGSKVVHDMNRKYLSGDGTFDSVFESVKRLFKYNEGSCKVVARLTVATNTYNYLKDSICYLAELGFKTIKPVLDEYGKWNSQLLEEIYKEYTAVYDLFGTNKKVEIAAFNVIRFREHSECLAGLETMHIDVNGNILPCAYVINEEKFILGNVIYGLDANKVQIIDDINRHKMNECGDCAWSDKCISVRCKFINYAKTGDFYQPVKSSCLIERLYLRLDRYVSSHG